MMTCVYRHFDSRGKLLYVGMAEDLCVRTRCHSYSSHWFRRVRNVTAVYFPTREEAASAEKYAIGSERPEFNKNLRGDGLSIATLKRMALTLYEAGDSAACIAEIMGMTPQRVGMFIASQRREAKAIAAKSQAKRKRARA